MQKEKKKEVTMDIKVPSGMKSPMVVIVGGGTMVGDEKSNKMHEKRMDLLEKKLNQQYKNKTEGKSDTRELETILKSFIKKQEKLISQNRQVLSSQNSKLLDALKNIKQEVRVIKEPSDNGEIKSFIKKLDNLEDAIRKIPLKTRTISVNRSVKLDDSFQKMFERLETTIKNSRPRLQPSPS